MPFQRSSGILLHPSSLPSRGGIGDLGPAAHLFVEFLAASRQTLWQVLPLGPTGIGNSPYSSTSAFAGNPLLISLERLAQKGWLRWEQLAELPGERELLDYDRVRKLKLPLLQQAARNFLREGALHNKERYTRFCEENRGWLEDYALFEVLREKQEGTRWGRWPQALAQREGEVMTRARSEFAGECETSRVLQFAFFEQWRALRTACKRRGIRVVGDAAIFVSYDSADVWTHPELFQLDENLQPYVVAGVPPDAFSQTGQRWGNPLYRWDVMRASGYAWWIERVRCALRCCDILRLDHFRGFEQYWEIPSGEPTAINGRWAMGPGEDLFHALRHALGDLPLIAEDLGIITPAVTALRERFDLPGMRILQFGFGDWGSRYHLPHRYFPNTVVYTGTHDNDTVRGWWQHGANEQERGMVRAYLSLNNDNDLHWAFVSAACTSVADQCILPLQDVLGLGSEARMNIPSRPDGNWTWRFHPEHLTQELAARLAALASASDRDAGLRNDAPVHDDEFAA